MIVRITTRLAASPDRIWKHVQAPRLLRFVSCPVIIFRSREPSGFPDRWQDGPHRVWMWLFGVIPLGSQTICISRGRTEDGGYWLLDAGSGALVQVWDHLITIEPGLNGETLYTDEVDIRAGLVTPLVAGFAQAFYRWRQHRWRMLIERGFLNRPRPQSGHE